MSCVFIKAFVDVAVCGDITLLTWLVMALSFCLFEGLSAPVPVVKARDDVWSKAEGQEVDGGEADELAGILHLIINAVSLLFKSRRK